MTRFELERLARSALTELAPELQEKALMRATGKPVICWPYATCETLLSVYGSARAVALLYEI